MGLFKKTSVGLDIADNSIEVVSLEKSGRNINITSSNRAILPSGIVHRGKIIDEEKLAESLKVLFGGAQPIPLRPKEIIFGLPESQVYTHVFTLPEHDEKNRENIIAQEIETNIPIESSDLLYSYKLISPVKESKKSSTVKDDDKSKDTSPEDVEVQERTEVIAVATSASIVMSWQEFFKGMEIEVEFFDIETLACYRSLFQKLPSTPVCLIDLGSMKTNISIFDNRGMRSSYSSLVAGTMLREEISEKLGISEEEAESKKIGADLNQSGNDITKIIFTVLDPLLKEVSGSLSNFESLNKTKVGEIILIGGLSQMKGLTEHMSRTLGIPAKIGVASWPGNEVPLLYIEALGLAFRGLQKKWEKRDPFFSPPDIEKIKIDKERNAKEIEKIGSIKEGEDQSKNVSYVHTRDNKLKKQKITLLLIVVVGILVIGSSLWFRSNSRNQRVSEIDSKLITYAEIQTFHLEIPIAVVSDEYTSDRVRGRIVADEVVSSGSYHEAMQNSKRKVQKEVTENEILWDDPLDAVEDEERVEFPVQFRWLVFNDQEANELFLEKIHIINILNVDFELNNIVKTGIEKTDNPAILSMNGDVSLSLNKLIETDELTNEEIKPTTKGPVDDTKQDNPKEVLVTILDTPVGYLNVRSGPNTSYAKVTTVSPGAEFLVLEEENKWYKIRIDDELEGWITSDYASIIN